MLPTQLVGPVFTTVPAFSTSLDHLEKAGMATRGVGSDLRTRPVALPDAGHALAEAIAGPRADFVETRLSRLDELERAVLCHILVKGSGLWDEMWPDAAEND